jgi:hypothetical protein
MKVLDRVFDPENPSVLGSIQFASGHYCVVRWDGIPEPENHQDIMSQLLIELPSINASRPYRESPLFWDTLAAKKLSQDPELYISEPTTLDDGVLARLVTKAVRHPHPNVRGQELFETGMWQADLEISLWLNWDKNQSRPYGLYGAATHYSHLSPSVIFPLVYEVKVTGKPLGHKEDARMESTDPSEIREVFLEMLYGAISDGFVAQSIKLIPDRFLSGLELILPEAAA